MGAFFKAGDICLRDYKESVKQLDCFIIKNITKVNDLILIDDPNTQQLAVFIDKRICDLERNITYPINYKSVYFMIERTINEIINEYNSTFNKKIPELNIPLLSHMTNINERNLYRIINDNRFKLEDIMKISLALHLPYSVSEKLYNGFPNRQEQRIEIDKRILRHYNTCDLNYVFNKFNSAAASLYPC